jgi:hypothetical protein
MGIAGRAPKLRPTSTMAWESCASAMCLYSSRGVPPERWIAGSGFKMLPKALPSMPILLSVLRSQLAFRMLSVTSHVQ